MSIGPIDFVAVLAKMNDNVSHQDKVNKSSEDNQRNLGKQLKEAELRHDSVTNEVKDLADEMHVSRDKDDSHHENDTDEKKQDVKISLSESENLTKKIIQDVALGAQIDIER